jgi:hypothetical protein
MCGVSNGRTFDVMKTPIVRETKRAGQPRP